MARYWGRSQATRELSWSIYKSSAKEDIAQKINEILNSNTQNRLKNYSIELEKIQKELEESYTKIMNSIFMDSDVFEDLRILLSKNENQQNLATLLSNNAISDKTFQNDISSYINNYNRMYNGMINATEEVNSIMEKFRGDRMLYGIGTSSSLSIMSRTAYSELERNNRDLFELKYNYNEKTKAYTLSQLQFTDEKYHLATGNTNYSTLKDRIYKLSEERNDIINNILPYNNPSIKDKTFKQTWDTLRTTKIFSSQAEGKTAEELGNMKNISKYAWAARKLEYLFSPDLNLEDLSSLNYKINNAENILGFATGDVNIATTINGQDYKFALQMKYYNGTQPWNGTSISSLQNSLKFLSNKDGLFSEFANAINNNNDTNSMNRFFKEKFNYSLDKMEELNSAFAYNQINNIFKDAFGENPLFMDFLDSEECEQMKEDIYNDWMEASTDANNEESESYDNGDSTPW